MGQLETVPDSNVLPKCDVIAKIADFKRTKTSTGKKMYVLELRIQDDGEGRFKNTPLWDRFYIGTDEDPEAEEIKTWQKSGYARTMRRLFKKLGLELSKDVDDLIVEAEGQDIGISVLRYTEPDKTKKRIDGVLTEIDNDYAGQPRNRIVGYWTPGEKAPQIYAEEEDAPQHSSNEKPAVKSAAVDEDELPSGGSSPKAPEPVALEAGNGALKDASEAAPIETATATNGAAKAGPAKKEKELACPQCKVAVVKSAFMDHIQACTA